MNDNAEHKRTVAEILVELREAEERERKEIEAKQRLVKPIYKFTLVDSTFIRPDHKLLSSGYCLYELRGAVLNKEELRAVHRIPFEGSMSYVYDLDKNQFIIEVSGGTKFTDNTDCWDELGEFIKDNPKGGDVTHIVSKYFPGNWG